MLAQIISNNLFSSNLPKFQALSSKRLSTHRAHLSMYPWSCPKSSLLLLGKFFPAGSAYLDRWLNRDPGWKHQTGIQRLGSNTEVNPTLRVTGPDMLISTGQAGQSHGSCRGGKHIL